MEVVHQIVDQKPDKTTTKCGLSFDPRRKTGQLLVTIWSDFVSCPGCTTVKQ